MPNNARWYAAGLIGLGLCLGPVQAPAQEPKPVRVRGTIERLDGDAFIIKTRDGSEVMPQPDGSQRAVEVHIFTEAMRGTGDGHYGWDLVPQSTMTNGNVEQSVVGTDGQALTVKYKDGEKKVIVTPDTQIVLYTPGEASELKPGAKIFIGAAKPQPDGSLQTPRINVGRDGVTPPM
jgi:hypothetical protein